MPPSVKAEFSRSPISSIAAIVATFCAIGTLATGIVLAVRWTESIEMKVAYNHEQDLKHHGDPSLHMPYEHKIEKFVTRQEWVERGLGNTRQFEEIKASQIRTEAKLDKLIDKFIQ
jgi:hypothetical protein